MSITDKYYNECVFCGTTSDQAEWIQSCVKCRRPLVQKNGDIDWLSITKRLLATLERAELDEMNLIGVINYITRQPETKHAIDKEDVLKIVGWLFHNGHLSETLSKSTAIDLLTISSKIAKELQIIKEAK